MKGREKISDWKNSIQYVWRLLFTCIVNSAKKERKMNREDKYYSRISTFIRYDGAITRGLVAESS